ncbi:MAG: VCBS repeat-containing protein, partial [Gemmatimonadota bacterium]|nr:VCBS repeat-containing protein [Gemmatimonadota bacterium]
MSWADSMSVRRVLVLALLALACGRDVDTTWQEAEGYRWRTLDVSRRGTPGFTLLDPARTGITFANTVSESLLVRNRILAQGAGVCLGNVDSDELPDVFLARTEGPNSLYRNLGGWRFEEITQPAGVGAPDRFSSGCAFADVDGDRDLDLILVALGGPNALFLNEGGGRFAEQAEAAGLTS